MMKALILVIFLGSMMVIGSSGTFVSFGANREVRVNVVPHENEYLGFDCEDGYSGVVVAYAGEEADFNAITLRNHLNELRAVSVTLWPDYSGLPSGVLIAIDGEYAPRIIDPEEEYTFLGHVSVGDATPGEYLIPMSVYAEWGNGDASISACPLKLVVRGGPTIKKVLLEGNLTVPMKTYEEWAFAVILENPWKARNLTITDVVPGEFVVENITISTGDYEMVLHGKSSHITWEVELAPNETAQMTVKVHTRLVSTKKGDKWEFTSCGDYYLNEGAIIKEYNVVSEGILVKALCEDDD
ncbi:MAG: hypothetical protein PWQ79_636 [Thermococcaceae archaeon]|nr:hypothetical protein [Thermococcaceae archaeon]